MAIIDGNKKQKALTLQKNGAWLKQSFSKDAPLTRCITWKVLGMHILGPSTSLLTSKSEAQQSCTLTNPESDSDTYSSLRNTEITNGME